MEEPSEERVAIVAEQLLTYTTEELLTTVLDRTDDMVLGYLVEGSALVRIGMKGVHVKTIIAGLAQAHKVGFRSQDPPWTSSKD